MVLFVVNGLLDQSHSSSPFGDDTKMSKVLLSTLVAALVCVAVSNAKAANGISASTLNDMGFSALTVMSDSDALAIRGKGFNGHSSDLRPVPPHGTVDARRSAIPSRP